MLRTENLRISLTNKRTTDKRTTTPHLVENVSLAFKPGELTLILGANGAGKSTLLNALAGSQVRHPALQQQGRVTLDNQDLAQFPAKELARRRAVMPQQVQLDFPFKVHEVIAMGRSPYGMDSLSQRITDQAMALLEVDHLQHRDYPSLSGGEQQRVQLARVLAQIWPHGDKPRPQSDHEAGHTKRHRVLLLDECTSALDPAHQHQVLDIIKQFTTPDIISCAVLHDLPLAARYGDRVILMKQGRVIADGTPRQVLTADNLAATYDLRTRILQHQEVDHPIIVGLGRATQRGLP